MMQRPRISPINPRRNQSTSGRNQSTSEGECEAHRGQLANSPTRAAIAPMKWWSLFMRSYPVKETQRLTSCCPQPPAITTSSFSIFVPRPASPSTTSILPASCPLRPAKATPINPTTTSHPLLPQTSPLNLSCCSRLKCFRLSSGYFRNLTYSAFRQ